MSRVEAYGVRGLQSKPWRRIFASHAALHAWCERSDAEVHAFRELDPPVEPQHCRGHVGCSPDDFPCECECDACVAVRSS